MCIIPGRGKITFWKISKKIGSTDLNKTHLSCVKHIHKYVYKNIYSVQMNRYTFIIQTIQFNESSNNIHEEVTLLCFKQHKLLQFYIRTRHRRKDKARPINCTSVRHDIHTEMKTEPTAICRNLSPFSISVNAALRPSLGWNWQQLEEKQAQRPAGYLELLCSQFSSSLIKPTMCGRGRNVYFVCRNRTVRFHR